MTIGLLIFLQALIERPTEDLNGGVIIQSVLYGYGPSCILGASIGWSNIKA